MEYVFIIFQLFTQSVKSFNNQQPARKKAHSGQNKQLIKIIEE